VIVFVFPKFISPVCHPTIFYYLYILLNECCVLNIYEENKSGQFKSGSVLKFLGLVGLSKGTCS